MSDDNDEDNEVDGSLTILKSQQSKERKEMKAKITALKHGIPKNNVKKKKEVMRQIEEMEDVMKKRHLNQLLELDNSLKFNENSIITEEKKGEELLNETAADDSICTFFKEIKLSKSQQKKENKRKEQENKRLLATQKDEEGAIYSKSYKENEAIKNLLNMRKLKLKDIQPDGDCLYKAISHQLLLNGLKYTAEELRDMAAEYIKENKEEFVMYLIDSEGKLINEDSFDDYCTKVKYMCSQGGDWGGEPEIRALSDVLQVSINVLNADGTLNKFGDYPSITLLITYHRHAYSLGEHYNSTQPSSTSEYD